VSRLPGLEGLTLVEDALDGAVRRTAEAPGYTGTAPAKTPAEAPELVAAET
jgi:hypothetical protein